MFLEGFGLGDKKKTLPETSNTLDSRFLGLPSLVEWLIQIGGERWIPSVSGYIRVIRSLSPDTFAYPLPNPCLTDECVLLQLGFSSPSLFGYNFKTTMRVFALHF